jgi:3'-phosphoadenosine 5'-phosphosulfate (PAPS) 3'-phosphatase
VERARPEVPATDGVRYRSAAIELADEARRIVDPTLREGFRVETKLDRSLVTDVDPAVGRRLRERIGHWFPEHGVLGEEYPATGADRIPVEHGCGRRHGRHAPALGPGAQPRAGRGGRPWGDLPTPDGGRVLNAVSGSRGSSIGWWDSFEPTSGARDRRGAVRAGRP